MHAVSEPGEIVAADGTRWVWNADCGLWFGWVEPAPGQVLELGEDALMERTPQEMAREHPEVLACSEVGKT
jgi:hypothetical protein